MLPRAWRGEALEGPGTREAGGLVGGRGRDG